MFYPEVTHIPIAKIPYLLHLTMLGTWLCELVIDEPDDFVPLGCARQGELFWGIPQPDPLDELGWNLYERICIYQTITPFLHDYTFRGLQGQAIYVNSAN